MSDDPDKQTHDAETAVRADAPAVAPQGGDAARRSSVSRRTLAVVLSCAAAVALLIYFGLTSGWLKRAARQAGEALSPQADERAERVDPYASALTKVQEDRGEPAGRQAKVTTPPELKHYKDTRRFLAIQEAAAREADLDAPHDFAELVGMVKDTRQWVEVPKLGDGYVLYGVGLMAAGRPTHYDRKGGKSVPLFADEAELKTFLDQSDAERARLESELKSLADALKPLGKADKEARAQLQSETAAKKKELDGVRKEAELVGAQYETPKGRRKLFAEYDALDALARDFGGRAYDLRDQTSAKEFEARLLRYLRPPALSVLEELGAAYQSKFERPLPVTSLVRTEEYQRRLRETGNPNAADVSVPPHTTGLAFDIFYRYMTAAEQEFVMGEIARLEREGRVEALRELRDHYHVFVFPEGRRPGEKAIEKAKRK